MPQDTSTAVPSNPLEFKIERILVPLDFSTLLIVGERDEDVLRLNETAYEQLNCKKALAVVPDATHLFEEPGALEEVARLAAEWFAKHLKSQL
jgi:pimeloyl-ACP methyl ester carboxylesterase